MRRSTAAILVIAVILLALYSVARTGGSPFDLTMLIFLLLAGVVVFVGLSSMQRVQRVQKVEAAVHGDFADYMLEVLANAAKIDGRIDESERQAMVELMSVVKGAPFARPEADAALARARFSKQELVAYLGARAKAFSVEQKTQLLKGVLTVAMADGRFDEREHDVYLDYINAVGFEGQSAPDMLKRWVRDVSAGKYS